ncbi:hypothetical protein A1Q1_01969 [Trichosporon asahii var. asahii CBS 2479]|uniref:Uncharacterized protein n=1 Tax=Trichosporon asahii var. asahii (strain ATCC 90039 / CBS 2479 / JCM 2466 / KCTC 7840 / NBRC 103889/ NCYC 2677 / UAMH 7654) TaxID=1186058 RepID=J4UD41_TRIAS|nr:hypothetical protein A1Q1_01969 [Trichosporon asahii var. asahii CBS 2479]EJT48980.1 hypothetical protein A1Q1_01969 [Trichosporon asahii var. asahii CBS 2479]
MSHLPAQSKEAAGRAPLNAERTGSVEQDPLADDALRKSTTSGLPSKKPSYTHSVHSPTPHSATTTFPAALLRRSHTPGPSRPSADHAGGNGFPLGGGVSSIAADQRIEFMPYDTPSRSPERQIQPSWMDIGNEAQDPFAQQTLPAAVPDHLANAAPTLNHQSARGESARVNSHHTPHAGDNRALVQVDRQQAFRRSDNTDGGVESFDDIIGGIGKGRQGNAHLSEQSLQDIWSSVQEQCKYNEFFPLNDVNEILDSHRFTAGYEDVHRTLRCRFVPARLKQADPSERQQLVEKAQSVLKKMRKKTEKYDDARQKVISSVAQRPPKRKFCPLL